MKPLVWALSGRRHRAAVSLMYHRVADVSPDPWDIVVSPANFEEHMAVLRDSYRPVGLQRLIADLDAGSIESGTVAVTFDDGYADNVERAKPALDHFEVPALFFVATEAIGAVEEFWWDDLERMFLEPGTLPAHLTSTTLGRCWDLDGWTVYTPEAAAEHRTWRSGRPVPTRRHEVFLDLWRRLFVLPAARRRVVLDELRTLTGTPRQARPGHRAMTGDELTALSSDGCHEIGSHTVSHTQLPALSAAEQSRELVASRAWLQEHLGRGVAALAYPNGEHDRTTVSLAAAAGYAVAFTTEFGLVDGRSGRYRLPRVKPPNVGGDGFDAWLRHLITPCARVPA